MVPGSWLSSIGELIDGQSFELSFTLDEGEWSVNTEGLIDVVFMLSTTAKAPLSIALESVGGEGPTRRILRPVSEGKASKNSKKGTSKNSKKRTSEISKKGASVPGRNLYTLESLPLGTYTLYVDQATALKKSNATKKNPKNHRRATAEHRGLPDSRRTKDDTMDLILIAAFLCGDANGDLSVDQTDIDVIVSFLEEQDGTYCAMLDSNRDGIIDAADLAYAETNKGAGKGILETILSVRGAFERALPLTILKSIPQEFLEVIEYHSPTGLIPATFEISMDEGEDPVQFPELTADNNSVVIFSGCISTDLSEIPEDTVVNVYSLNNYAGTVAVDVDGCFSLQIPDVLPGRNIYFATVSSPNFNAKENNRRFLGESSGSGFLTFFCKYPGICPPALSFTLKWDGETSDVDLRVLEPAGKAVSWQSRRGDDGFLDIDDVWGYGPENYIAETVSEGTEYVARVEMYRIHNDIDVVFTLDCRIGGQLLWTESGTLGSTGDRSAVFPVSIDSDPNKACLTCQLALDEEVDDDGGRRLASQGLPNVCTKCEPKKELTNWACLLFDIYTLGGGRDCDYTRPNPEWVIWDKMMWQLVEEVNQDTFTYWALIVVGMYQKGINPHLQKTLKQLQKQLGDPKCGGQVVLKYICQEELIQDFTESLATFESVATSEFLSKVSEDFIDAVVDQWFKPKDFLEDLFHVRFSASINQLAIAGLSSTKNYNLLLAFSADLFGECGYEY